MRKETEFFKAPQFESRTFRSIHLRNNPGIPIVAWMTVRRRKIGIPDSIALQLLSLRQSKSQIGKLHIDQNFINFDALPLKTDSKGSGSRAAS